MEITDIRQKLHQFIDTIEDKKAEAMYALFENEIEEESEGDIQMNLRQNLTGDTSIIRAVVR